MRTLTDGGLGTIYGISGVLIGALVAGSIFLIQRHYGRKKHLFDERYWEKTNRAKARSWDATLVTLIIAWIVCILYEGIGFSFFLITGIYVLHNSALIFFNVFFASKTDDL